MGFFDASNQENGDRKIEIRPGRSIFCKRVSWVAPAAANNSDSDNDNNNNNNKSHLSHLNILFVHGSCACSSQYDDLISEIKCILEEVNDKDGGVRLGVPYTVNCYLYDQLGCSNSNHSLEDWSAFSTLELNLDLQTIITSILAGSTRSDEMPESADSSLFLVGHSHGCSQIIQSVNTLASEEASKIKGVILMGGALNDGPTGLAVDGGHWIFKYLPMFMLNKMQPSLSQSFFDAAVHPSNRDRLRSKAMNISNRNDMRFCKAFYRQQKYATSEEARQLKVSVYQTAVDIYQCIFFNCYV